MDTQFQELKAKYDALAARVATLERAFVPTEGELTVEKVREGILKGNVAPLMEWIRKGFSTEKL